MPKFKVAYDEKGTIWIRTSDIIEADTLEEAQDILKARVNDEDLDNELPFEFIPNSFELITRKENFVMTMADSLLPDDNWDIGCDIEVKEFEEHVNHEII